MTKDDVILTWPVGVDEVRDCPVVPFTRFEMSRPQADGVHLGLLHPSLSLLFAMIGNHQPYMRIKGESRMVSWGINEDGSFYARNDPLHIAFVIERETELTKETPFREHWGFYLMLFPGRTFCARHDIRPYGLMRAFAGKIKREWCPERNQEQAIWAHHFNFLDSLRIPPEAMLELLPQDTLTKVAMKMPLSQRPNESFGLLGSLRAARAKILSEKGDGHDER